MFSAWVQNGQGDTICEYFDCIRISILTPAQMQELFPEIFIAFSYDCNYFLIVDDAGNHFYPQFAYSIEIG